MSRFFVSGYNSESSSEEDALLSSSEEELVSSEEELSSDSEFNEPGSDSSDSDDDVPTGPSYFLKKDFRRGAANSDSDSESDDEGRKVVKSAKDKLIDDIKEAIEGINVAKRNNIWSSVLTEFERVGRLLTKSNQQNFGVPKFYIKCLGGLEDFIEETNENEKSEKTLNAAEARSFNTTKQRVRKQIKEYQEQYDLFKKSPELFEGDEPINAAQAAGDVLAGELSSSGAKAQSHVFTVLKQISESRGKKNIDKFEQVQNLEDLLIDITSSGTPFELICVYQMLLSIRFDASANHVFMPIDEWKKNEKDTTAFLELLEKNLDTYRVSEFGSVTDDIDIEPTPNAEGIRIIAGSITSYIDRLDDELIKSLQNIDPHSSDYIERLKDESKIYKLIVRGQCYVELTTPEEAKFKAEQLGRMVLKRLEHIYYKADQLIAKIETDAWSGVKGDSGIVPKRSSPADLVEGLSKFLSNNSNIVYGKQSLLYKIYYNAVNDNYSVARDLFLSSSYYLSMNNAESYLQVYYNRALVQLALCAFRAGSIEEAHQALNDISNSSRSKELLGQGFNSKYPSQATVAEKQRLLPFHMHINLELLECVYMTSSLLIEIPALAAASNANKESRKRASIKSFKSKLDFYERQYFTGPPESIKDHIVYASVNLQKGDWLKAYNLLSSIKIWNLFTDNAKLLAMMKRQLQVEGLRTYIFTYKSVFSKLSLEKLSKIFDLDNEDVISILNKMLNSGDVSGEISENNKFINFTTLEPQRSKLQELAIVMNEKVGLLTEKNEKTASNGHGRKLPPLQQQQQKEQKEQKELIQEENNKFRCANVNLNNDEFQTAF